MTTNEVKRLARAFLPVSDVTRGEGLSRIGVQGGCTTFGKTIVNRAGAFGQTLVGPTRSTILIAPRMEQIRSSRRDTVVKVIRSVKLDAVGTKGQILQPQRGLTAGDKRNIRETGFESLQPSVRKVIRMESAPAPVHGVPVSIQERGTTAPGLGYARNHTVTLQRKSSVGLAVTPVIMLQRKSSVGLAGRFISGCD